MSNSVQYSALTRLLAHNNRIHDLGEILSRMPVVLGREHFAAWLDCKTTELKAARPLFSSATRTRRQAGSSS